MEEKICTCGEKMVKAQLSSGMFGSTNIVVQDENNNMNEYRLVPYVCTKCGKTELYADFNNQNGDNVFVGGVFF